VKDYSRIRTGPVTTETHALDKFHDVFEEMQVLARVTDATCGLRTHAMVVLTDDEPRHTLVAVQLLASKSSRLRRHSWACWRTWCYDRFNQVTSYPSNLLCSDMSAAPLTSIAT
jgi:hypothetical protein